MPNTEPQALTLTLCRFAGGGRRQSVPSLAPLYSEVGEGGGCAAQTRHRGKFFYH